MDQYVDRPNVRLPASIACEGHVLGECLLRRLHYETREQRKGTCVYDDASPHALASGRTISSTGFVRETLPRFLERKLADAAAFLRASHRNKNIRRHLPEFGLGP